MFGTGRQRNPVSPAAVLAIAAVAAVLIGVQVGALVVLVGGPLERGLVAAREPRPSRVLVRVPEYAEELEVVGPPRWQRELLRMDASRRAPPTWLAEPAAAPGSLVCPASVR